MRFRTGLALLALILACVSVSGCRTWATRCKDDGGKVVTHGKSSWCMKNGKVIDQF